MNVLPTVCMCTMCMPGTFGAEESAGCPGTGVTDDFKLPCRYWKPNPGPLQGQQVLLNSEPSF